MGGVAKTLEKVTVLVSGDGLAWIGRTTCSLAAYALNLGLLQLVRISPNKSEML